MRTPDPGQESYRDHADTLRKDFRNGLAHGFAVKKGGFEFPSSRSPPNADSNALQIDPDQLLDDFKKAVHSYFESVRHHGSDSKLGTAFSKRFDSVFEIS